VKKFRGTLVYLGVVSALLAGAVAARADTITVAAHFQSDAGNLATTYLTSNYNDSVAGTSANPTVDVYAGIYAFTTTTAGDGATVSSGGNLGTNEANYISTKLAGGFSAVCVDFTHNVNFGQGSTWTVENITANGGVGLDGNGIGINAKQASAITYLWDIHRSIKQAADAASGAAFQMAVWDVVYDGHLYDASLSGNKPAPSVSYLTPGATTLSDTAKLANSWAADAEYAANHGYVPNGNVYALVNTSGVQSFNFAILDPVGTGQFGNVVPLPAAAGVGFSMLGGFGMLAGLRKRLRRRARIA
jgi:hypothetical protein